MVGRVFINEIVNFLKSLTFWNYYDNVKEVAAVVSNPLYVHQYEVYVIKGDPDNCRRNRNKIIEEFNGEISKLEPPFNCPLTTFLSAYMTDALHYLKWNLSQEEWCIVSLINSNLSSIKYKDMSWWREREVAFKQSIRNKIKCNFDNFMSWIQIIEKYSRRMGKEIYGINNGDIFITIIPIITVSSIGEKNYYIGGLHIISEGELNSDLMRDLLRVVLYYQYKASEIYYTYLHIYSMWVAVAAIMSRNLSHNIGSHVLAYLRMEKLFDLAVRLVNKDDGESLNKIKGLIDKIAAYQSSIQSLCDSLKNAGSDQLKDKLNEAKQELHSNEQEIKGIINSLTGNELRWGLTEWVEDTKVFFEYLQHRMDFLAQISTEWPEWTFSAYLMKDIMRYFLSQRHLLDGIAKSEGLRGFYYDWEDPFKNYLNCKSKNEKKEEYGRIKVHVLNLGKIGDKEARSDIWSGNNSNIKERIGSLINDTKENFKIEKEGNDKTIVEHKRILLYSGKYENSKEIRPSIDEGDIQIAIPGGIVGYHAFYVIIENVIRNSAKHSYPKARKNSGIEDLEIVIEFIDDPMKPDEQWLFRIYDNVSKADKKLKGKEDKKFRIFPENFPEEEISPEKDLVAYMNWCLRHSIIKETGELDKRHWGMAEMKIVAGYLQGRDISRIGAEGDDITGSENNQEGKEDFIIRAIESPIGTLGFEFRVRKPREVGIVCVKGEGA